MLCQTKGFRVFALLLTCFLLCTLRPAARAGAAALTPPSWCRLEEYVVFEGSAAYEPENWEKILLLRADAEAGGATPKKDGDAQSFEALSALLSALDALFKSDMISVPGVTAEALAKEIL